MICLEQPEIREVEFVIRKPFETRIPRNRSLNIPQALKYLKFIREQRNGDLTLLQVPADAAGFVTGANGVFLRTCEDQYASIMFFCEVAEYRDKREYRGVEWLAIFGDELGRKGASLKVMDAVETKHAG